MGNPHCVIFVDDVDAVPLPIWGASVERNSMFPERINAHFIQVISPTELRQRTWERGAGATLACGTGACASLVAAFTDGKSERKATVHLPGGDLEIEYAEDGSVFMTGPAETVFEGTWG
jgi:diaminopimelate epimerase